MALMRLRDANVLIRGGRWEFAYYVSGYAVECALKACLLTRMIHTAWVFEERWRASDCLTHDLAELIRLAGLTDALNARLAASAASGDSFRLNWPIALRWGPASRYVATTEADARELYAAITHRPDGVPRWLRNYW
jgi:hypothetical protein